MADGFEPQRLVVYAGQDDHGHVGGRIHQLLQGADPMTIGQREIDQRGVECRASQLVHRVGHRFHVRDVESLHGRCQRVLQQLGVGRMIFDEQYGRTAKTMADPPTAL